MWFDSPDSDGDDSAGDRTDSDHPSENQLVGTGFQNITTMNTPSITVSPARSGITGRCRTGNSGPLPHGNADPVRMPV
jgi:hypothetical protein